MLIYMVMSNIPGRLGQIFLELLIFSGGTLMVNKSFQGVVKFGDAPAVMSSMDFKYMKSSGLCMLTKNATSVHTLRISAHSDY